MMKPSKYCALVSFFLVGTGLIDQASGFGLNSQKDAVKTHAASSSETGRRQALSLLVGTAATLLTTVSDEAEAFENKISNKYDDRPKRRGPVPKDLGVSTRLTIENDEYQGLKICGPAPNCFSSTIPAEEDPDHSIPAWTWPAGQEKAAAFAQLKQVLESYPPGQNGIDGGGFQIQKYDEGSGYIYVVFEALKNGYHDDVEFATIDSVAKDAIQVRSSSRVGYLDFTVNAKRLNWIAKALREKGWKAEGVEYNTHRGYFVENQTS